jgi:hypothetical protein
VRAIGYAPYGGADVGECLAVAGQVAGNDLDSWHDAWTGTAARVAGQAEASAAAGRVASTRSGFFRAANYFRTAGLFAMGAPLDPRLTEDHRQEVENFRRGAALLPVPRFGLEGLDVVPEPDQAEIVTTLSALFTGFAHEHPRVGGR